MNAPRLAAPLEVLGIYLAGSLVTQLLRAILQADVATPLNDFRVDITNAELIAASGTSFVLLVLAQGNENGDWLRVRDDFATRSSIRPNASPAYPSLNARALAAVTCLRLPFRILDSRIWNGPSTAPAGRTRPREASQLRWRTAANGSDGGRPRA